MKTRGRINLNTDKLLNLRFFSFIFMNNEAGGSVNCLLPWIALLLVFNFVQVKYYSFRIVYVDVCCPAKTAYNIGKVFTA